MATRPDPAPPRTAVSRGGLGLFDGPTSVLRIALALIVAILWGCAARERPQISSSAPSNPNGYGADAQVYVEREVRRPGAYPWTNGMRLTDAINRAGGFTEFAPSRFPIYHSDGTSEIHDYGRILKKKSANPLLRSGDRVAVVAPIF